MKEIEVTLPELQEFSNYLQEVLDNVYRSIDNNEPTNTEEFAVKIAVGRKEITIPMNADLFSSLDTLIKNEIDNY